MPAISFPEYVQRITDVLNDVTASGEATLANFEIDQRSSVLGLISGILEFADGAALHFKEFVNTSLSNPKMMYSYHYQDTDNNLILWGMMTRDNMLTHGVIKGFVAYNAGDRGADRFTKRNEPSEHKYFKALMDTMEYIYDRKGIKPDTVNVPEETRVSQS